MNPPPIPHRQVNQYHSMDVFPTQAINYTPAFHLVYNPDMPSMYDENTVYRPGINTGMVNNMRLSLSLNDDTMTVLEFVHNIKKTGDHVDEAEIVGTVEITREDLPGLIQMLNKRLEDLITNTN